MEYSGIKGSISAEELVCHVKGLIYSLPFEIKKRGKEKAFEYLQSVLDESQQIREKLGEMEEFRLKQCFEEHIHPITNCSTACNYFLDQPRGYPGDSGAMEIIWKTRTHKLPFRSGSNIIGKCINDFTLSSSNCKSNELRVYRLKKYLLGLTSKTIASIGAGSVIEVEEAIKENPALHFEIHLFDQDKEACTASKNKLSNTKLNVLYHQGNVLKTILGLKDTTFDFIYSAGLFDYLTLKASKKLIKKLWAHLKPGGRLLITNAHPGNPTRMWMEYVGNWYLVYKTRR